MKTTSKTGRVVGILSVKEDSELMIVSQNGKMIRIESSTIRQAGRSTQGVRLVKLDEDDKVAAASVIPEAEEPPDNGRRRFRSSKLCRAAMAALGRPDNSRRDRGEGAQAVRRPDRDGAGDRGLLRRHGLGLSGMGGESRAGRERGGDDGGFGVAAGIAQARCGSLREALRHRARVHRDARVRQSGLRAATIRTAVSTARTSCSRAWRKWGGSADTSTSFTA